MPRERDAERAAATEETIRSAHEAALIGFAMSAARGECPPLIGPGCGYNEVYRCAACWQAYIKDYLQDSEKSLKRDYSNSRCS